jgi:hypothetical protein
MCQGFSEPIPLWFFVPEKRTFRYSHVFQAMLVLRSNSYKQFQINVFAFGVGEKVHGSHETVGIQMGLDTQTSQCSFDEFLGRRLPRDRGGNTAFLVAMFGA